MLAVTYEGSPRSYEARSVKSTWVAYVEELGDAFRSLGFGHAVDLFLFDSLPDSEPVALTFSDAASGFFEEVINLEGS